jgi:glycyl-tRNA synthetase
MVNIPVNKTAHPFDKVRFEALLNRRFFYAPAFEIYGGACGPRAFRLAQFTVYLSHL